MSRTKSNLAQRSTANKIRTPRHFLSNNDEKGKLKDESVPPRDKSIKSNNDLDDHPVNDTFMIHERANEEQYIYDTPFAFYKSSIGPNQLLDEYDQDLPDDGGLQVDYLMRTSPESAYIENTDVR